MKRLAILFYIVLFAPNVLAQGLEVRSHFSSSAFIVNRYLPFQLTDDFWQIVNVKVLGDADCSAILDPQYTSVFHVKCNEAATVTIQVTGRLNNSSFESTVLVSDIEILEPTLSEDETVSASSKGSQ